MNFEFTDKKRVLFTLIFCITIISTHILWRTIIDTGMENLDYQRKIYKKQDVGILAKTKDFIWESTIGKKPDRRNTDIRYISIFGYDLSETFEPLCKNTLNAVIPICNIFKPGFEGHEKLTKTGKRYILENRYYKNARYEIVWGCTSIKQIFMFFFIMLTTFGKIHHKMLYFILSIPFISLFNLLRISAITCLSAENMNRFSFFHDNIFRFVFYIFLFGLWLLWAEILTKRIYKQ